MHEPPIQSYFRPKHGSWLGERYGVEVSGALWEFVRVTRLQRRGKSR